jgi:hypothetical protein
MPLPWSFAVLVPPSGTEGVAQALLGPGEEGPVVAVVVPLAEAAVRFRCRRSPSFAAV